MTEIDYEMANIRLLKSLFMPNPKYNPQTGAALEKGTEISLSIKNSGDFNETGDTAHFSQEFKIESSSFMPFTLEVVFAAVFKTAAPIPKNKQAAYISSNFPQQVFPYLREYVSTITVRAGFPPVVLHMDYRPKTGKKEPVETTSVPRPVVKWIH
ncbi:MAG: protein-export chaperone SecB [Deltaproteobacteria bacterium]|jgi:preprotein translocase subunit SecB|nr:protein-export chaperone SecB [Deltaproteobacteria bacterium]